MIWDPYAKFEKKVLPNGLTIYACPMDRSFVEIGFLIHSGAREDPKGKEGVAHFVEHCCSMNAKNLTKGKIESFFRSIGGRVNLGETSYLSTKYSCALPSRTRPIIKALDIFSQMLLEEKITKNIESERNIIIQEYYRFYPYDADTDISLLFSKMTFPGHPREEYLRSFGKINTIKEISRSDLQKFYDLHYVPANISVIAAGGIIPEEFFSQVEKSPFGKTKIGNRNPVRKAEKSTPLPLTNRFDVSINLIFGKKAEIKHASYFSEAVLPGTISAESMQIFCTMIDEILDNELRQKRQWCYSLNVDYEYMQDLYLFTVDSKLAISCLPELEKTVEECVASISKKEKLFHEMKNYLIKEIKTLDLKCHNIVSESIEDLEKEGRIITLEELVQERKSVTFEQIKRIAELLQPEKRLTVIFYP